MTPSEIRTKFLNFFKERGHAVVSSSSLIPDDASVLLTTAGMQQFKPYYTGDADPMETIHPSLGHPIGSKNAVSVQKSFRTSDIDEVGDETHLTFFEMLGNFSFDGYGKHFKKEAIELAHKFITEEMRLLIAYVSVFEGDSSGSEVIPQDTESENIWRSLGVLNIKKFGKADNFWGPTGSEGPCGPTTEIYVKNEAGRPVEIWNIVFNQYFQDSEGRLDKLKTPGVDTGMGLERLAMVAQKKKNIFETDLFEPLIGLLPDGMDMHVKRIIADHIRATAFLISDGVRPSKKDAGYVLRRLMRRIIVHLINYPEVQLENLFNRMTAQYKDFYPELDYDLILLEFASEKEKFTVLLKTGVEELRRLKITVSNPSIVTLSLAQHTVNLSLRSGETERIGSWTLNISNSPIKLTGFEFSIEGVENLEFLSGAFLKIDELPSIPIGVLKERNILKIDSLALDPGSHSIELFAKISSNSAESFSVNDAILTGVDTTYNLFARAASTPQKVFNLTSTYGLSLELLKDLAPDFVKGLRREDFDKEFAKHQEVSRAGSEAKFGGHGLYLKTGEVTVKDKSELEKVTRLHTATHLLHAGLRSVLGPEVRQDGSDITVERTRFDFRFPRKVTKEELEKVEKWVNDAIEKDLKVEWKEMGYEEAVKEGALGFFKAKYPPRVKVYTVSDEKGEVYSKEFCGGPHVERTGTIGTFKITKEESSSAGVRRIRGMVEGSGF